LRDERENGQRGLRKIDSEKRRKGEGRGRRGGKDEGDVRDSY